MTELFYNIVNMSITAGILVLVVLLLRLVLKKAPKWVNVLLWGLVAVRLILPFAIESSLSLLPKTDWVSEESVHSENDLIYGDVPDSIPVDSIADPSLGKDITITYVPTDPEIEIHKSVSVPFILSCIWLAGIAGMLIYMAVSYLRVHHRIKNAKWLRENIYICDCIESPFVFGIIMPRICLPADMEEVSMAYVIAHEQAHISRRDHWWKPFGFLLLTVHWFNPLIWLSYILLCRDIEMACDEKVVRDMGDVERADYSQALLDCSVNRRMITACPLAFGEVGVKERIKSVLHYKKPAFWIIAFAVVVCAITAVCFLTNPIVQPVRSMDDYDWYFERAYNDNHEKGEHQELYQPGLQPKTEYAYPLQGILVPGDEPMWYDFIMGDWDTDRIGLHFIHEKTDSRNAHYTVEIYRDTGELIQGADAVMEPMTDSDGYVLTVYFTRDGYETRLIFTTKKPSEPAEGKKQLTLDDVITLSAKGRSLTWEDFAEFKSIETGSGLYIRVYEIDEKFDLWIGGGAPIGTPMYIYLSLADDSDTRIDIRDGGVEEFIQNANSAKPDKEIENIIFHSDRGGKAQALEMFYSDGTFAYYFPTIRSDVVIVYYKDGTEQLVKDAIAESKINISDLDRFGIKYYKRTINDKADIESIAFSDEDKRNFAYTSLKNGEEFSDPKTAIYSKMLNAIDYYNHVKIEFYPYMLSENLKVVCELDLDSGIAYQASYINNVLSQEFFSDGDTVSELNHKSKYYDKFYQKAFVREDSEPIALADRITTASDGLPCYNYRRNVTNCTLSSYTLFPQELAFSYLSDFTRWEIVEEGIFLGRECVIIEGENSPYIADKHNANTFRLTVDKDTGIVLMLTSEKGGRQTKMIEVTALEFDPNSVYQGMPTSTDLSGFRIID